MAQSKKPFKKTSPGPSRASVPIPGSAGSPPRCHAVASGYRKTMERYHEMAEALHREIMREKKGQRKRMGTESYPKR